MTKGLFFQAIWKFVFGVAAAGVLFVSMQAVLGSVISFVVFLTYPFISASNEPNAVLARVFGDCREGEIPRSLLRGISLLQRGSEMKKQC